MMVSIDRNLLEIKITVLRTALWTGNNLELNLKDLKNGTIIKKGEEM